MKSVVLDGYTLNPGDLSWDGLRAWGDVTVYDRSAPGEVVPRAADAEIVLTNKTVLSRDTIAQLTALRYIGVLATGYDVVDVDAAQKRGIIVTNVPSYGTRSVAQMVFAHLLNLTQHVGHHAQTVCEGRWAASPDWCYWDYPLIELDGLTMGVVGFGRIGQATAQLAQAFGMQVLAYDVSLSESPIPGVAMVDLETLLRQSDVVSLHVPLTPETEGMMNAPRLALMKPTAYLINTSRGAVIVADDLADALHNGRLAGAGLDVLPEEPALPDSPLVCAPNTYVTPHISWATQAARARLLDTAVDNVRAFLEGRPQNVVGARVRAPERAKAGTSEG